MNFLYFAYGSNMLLSRLSKRCPSARLVSTASAENYDVNFSKRSKDGSGKGAIVQKSESIAIGVIFEIDKIDLKELDRAEGLGYGYERRDNFQVTTNSGKRLETTTYIATDCDVELVPYDWYLALIIAGAIENELPQGYIEKLKATLFIPDRNTSRKSRIGAEEILAAIGYRNFDKLL